METGRSPAFDLQTKDMASYTEVLAAERYVVEGKMADM
jgi:hypothetical protein